MTALGGVAVSCHLHGGARRFCCGRIPGYHETEFTPRQDLTLIAGCKLTFGERFVLYRAGAWTSVRYRLQGRALASKNCNPGNLLPKIYTFIQNPDPLDSNPDTLKPCASSITPAPQKEY
jgi:hypothetical protein